MSKFMAGGRLIALNKNKEGSPLNIRPIVGRRILEEVNWKVHLRHSQGKDVMIFPVITV